MTERPVGDDNMPAVGDPDDWEWIGPDGLTDSEREESARRFAETIPVTREDIDRLKKAAAEGKIPRRKLSDSPDKGSIPALPSGYVPCFSRAACEVAQKVHVQHAGQHAGLDPGVFRGDPAT